MVVAVRVATVEAAAVEDMVEVVTVVTEAMAMAAAVLAMVVVVPRVVAG